MSEITAKDIVSSVFRKFEGKFLSPERIRDESSFLAKALDEKNPGDPGRIARIFFDEGFLQRNAASYYCYDSSKIDSSLAQQFIQFQYLYDRLPKDFKPTAFIRIPLGKVPETEEYQKFLSEKLRTYNQSFKTAGIHYFALKYAEELSKRQINNKELCQNAGISENYQVEIQKMKNVFDIIKQQNEIDYSSDDKINSSQSDAITEPEKPQSSYVSNHSQIIFYGVPGSGKSHRIEKELAKKIPDKERREKQVVRVVFHPEYTNADFVGQILPVLSDDGVNYKFKAGPFTRILKSALKNPENPYYLIIEEINRGNAAAIFGDLFQLLDRDSGGWSVYPIENLDINSFIRSKDNFYNDRNLESSVLIGSETFTENSGIRLPPNLSILATMNTSDQNVFTLDNAFQRRWDMRLVENKFENDEESQRQKSALIENSKVTWESFQTKINAEISKLSLENNLSSMVDKRLGCWFVKSERENENGKNQIKADDFKNKVLKYLWDDAFKFSRKDVFADAENFEELLKKVVLSKKDFGVFKEIQFEGNDGNADSEISR